MKILNKFVWSKTEPSNKNDVWFDGSVFNLYRNDTWEAFTLPIDAAEKVAEVIKDASKVFQEKLIAGKGIKLEDNVISTTQLFRVVDKLPLYGDKDTIYLVASSDTEDTNKLIEYTYINNSWEKLGEFKHDIDLSQYATIESVRRCENRISEIDNELRRLEDEEIQDLYHTKQDKLKSGVNIKTINGIPVLGEGDIAIGEDRIYITSFTITDLEDLINNPGRDIQADTQGLYKALNENKVILVPYGGDYHGYGIATGYVEDLYYLTIHLEYGRCIDLEIHGVDNTIYSHEVSERNVVNDNSFKTINGESIIGTGNISISGADNVFITDFTVNDLDALIANVIQVKQVGIQQLYEAFNEHKIILVPYDSNEGYHGYGVITGYMEDFFYITVHLENGKYIDLELDLNYDHITKDQVYERYWDNLQPKLVSKKNIKTINGQSILGEGNIEIEGGNINPETIEGFIPLSRDFSEDFNNDFAR